MKNKLERVKLHPEVEIPVREFGLLAFSEWCKITLLMQNPYRNITHALWNGQVFYNAAFN